MREDGRQADEIRKIQVRQGITQYAEGSVLIEFGQTHVVCNASVEDTLPKWLQGSGQGWVTAEYGMLPRATHTRNKRDRIMTSGRTQEISRLIARSLRAAIDLKALGERQVIVDCDVVQADGGTRTAAITGGFMALALAIRAIEERGEISTNPLRQYVAAISVGLKEDSALLDLCYEEDSAVDTDMNFVMTGDGRFVEIQGTAESDAFAKPDLLKMVELAETGCKNLFEIQNQVVGEIFPYKG